MAPDPKPLTMTLYPGAPHALDYRAYRDGVDRPAALLALEESDPFWRTLGGNTADPFGCGGETFRQRAAARELGVGMTLADMGLD